MQLGSAAFSSLIAPITWPTCAVQIIFLCPLRRIQSRSSVRPYPFVQQVHQPSALNNSKIWSILWCQWGTLARASEHCEGLRSAAAESAKLVKKHLCVAASLSASLSVLLNFGCLLAGTTCVGVGWLGLRLVVPVYSSDYPGAATLSLCGLVGIFAARLPLSVISSSMEALLLALLTDTNQEISRVPLLLSGEKKIEPVLNYSSPSKSGQPAFDDDLVEVDMSPGLLLKSSCGPSNGCASSIMYYPETPDAVLPWVPSPEVSGHSVASSHLTDTRKTVPRLNPRQLFEESTDVTSQCNAIQSLKVVDLIPESS